jgi:hypothetical protein
MGKFRSSSFFSQISVQPDILGLPALLRLYRGLPNPAEGARMKPVLYLRIASVLTLLHAILHTIGGVFGKVQPGSQMTAVEAMKANHFPLMGSLRSFWEFYRGMGLGLTIFLAAIALVLWQLGSLAKTGSNRLTPIYWTLMVAFVAMAVNSYLYFFWPPVIVELLIAVCLVEAIVTSKASAVSPG